MLARYGPPSAEQALGALPVVAGFCRKLDIAGIVDRAAPVREVARATHGQVIEALIANRLTSPAPMVHVAAWARQFAVGHVLGLAPDVLNDDRIARALDALAPVLEQVTGSAGAAAIAAYGIDVSQIHWDMTSVSLHGAYEHPDEGYAQPKFGHPKDRRAHVIRAVVAARQGDLEQAIHEGERAIAGQRSSLPTLLMVTRDLARVLKQQFPDEQAVKSFVERLRSLGE